MTIPDPAAPEQTWLDEWHGTSDPAASAPWLYDAVGAPIELPVAVIGFRARYLGPGSRGMGELVLDEEDGGPLFVPRTSGPDEFCRQVRWRVGKYRLAAIDSRFGFLSLVPIATYVITAAMARSRGEEASRPTALASSGVSAHDPLVLELVSTLRATLVESFQLLRASHLDNTRNVSELVRASATVVTAADGAGISRRDPLPVPIALPSPAELPALPAATVEPATAQPPTMADVFATALAKVQPIVQHLVNTKLFKLNEDTSLSILRASMGGGVLGGGVLGGGAPSPSPSSSPPSPAPQASPAPSGSPAPTPNASPTPAPEPEAAAQAQAQAFWTHVAAIEPLLLPDEKAVIHAYIASISTGPDQTQLVKLANELMARTPEDAAVWVRQVLAEISRGGASA